LAQRVLSMINRNCDAKVPEPGAFEAADEELLGEARALLERVRPQIAEQSFHSALETIWRVVGAANRYVDEQAPWALRRNDPARMRTVLYTLAEVLRHLGILTQPFVPDAAAALLDQLAVSAEARRFADLPERLSPGRPLPAPQGIFPRYVEAEAAAGN
jgi:methionyl-tRNA synthetase